MLGACSWRPTAKGINTLGLASVASQPAPTVNFFSPTLLRSSFFDQLEREIRNSLLDFRLTAGPVS